MFKVRKIEVSNESDNGYDVLYEVAFPASVSQLELDAWVKEEWPVEHCTHDYDCCAQLYSKGARVIHTHYLNDGRDPIALVKERVLRNI